MRKIFQQLKFVFVLGTAAVLGSSALLTVTNAQAETQPTTLNWQRLELEQKLKNDLTKVLNGVAGSDHFVLNVDIQYKKPVAAKVVAPVAKTDAPKKTEGTEEDPDLFLISKLGISTTAVFGDTTANPTIATGVTPVVIDPPDIFSLLEKVRVSCLLDTSIDDVRKEVIQKVINSQLLQFGADKTEVALDKAQLVAPVKEDRKPAAKDDKKDDKEEKKKDEKPVVIEKTMAEKFDPFKYPATIFLSFLTVMSMMFVLFRATKPQGAVAGAAAADAPAAAAKAEPEAAAPVAASGGGHDSAGSSHGHDSHGSGAASYDAEEVKLTVDKFKVFLKTSENKSRLLMLEWVNSDSPAALGALKALAMHLSLEEFSRVTAAFSLGQRKLLKKAMNADGSELPGNSEVMTFLRAQLMASVLTDDNDLNEQHRGFLSSLKASEIAELAAEEPTLAASVINVIPPDLVAQTFNSLNAETVSQVLQMSLQFKMGDVIAQFPQLEAKMKEIRDRSAVVLAPVLDGVEFLLEQVGPDKEGHLFSALLSSKAYVMVEDLSKRYFPSELVLQLEPAKINSVLLRMPLVKRAELIFSVGESERNIFFEAMSGSGKMRELIDSEIEGIQTDEGRKKTIELSRDVIWKQFVSLVRDAIRTNPMVQENAETILKTWIEAKKAELGQSTESPSAAA